jgi:putative transposon-encoded protein
MRITQMVLRTANEDVGEFIERILKSEFISVNPGETDDDNIGKSGQGIGHTYVVELLLRRATVYPDYEYKLNPDVFVLSDTVYTSINVDSMKAMVKQIKQLPADLRGMPVMTFGYPEHGKGKYIRREVIVYDADAEYIKGFEIRVSPIGGDTQVSVPKNFLREKITNLILKEFKRE